MNIYLKIMALISLYIVVYAAELKKSFPYVVNSYNDPEVRLCTTENFEICLLNSIDSCKKNGYKAIWLSLPAKHG